jgi:outer membrane protein TolC
MQTTRVSLTILFIAWHLSLLSAQDTQAATLSLTLRDAVTLAISPRGNLAVDVADQSVAVAQARLGVSGATIKPNIDFTFNAANQRINLDAYGFQSIHVPGFTFPEGVGPFEVLESRVHIRQSLFDMENLRRKDAARAGIVAAQAETDEVRDQVAGRVALLYLLAQRQASAVETAEALVAASESTLKEIGNHNAEGQALGVDVSEARVEVAAAKQNLFKAKLERARTEIELLNAMNRDLNTPLELTRLLRPPCKRAVRF